MKKFIFSLVFIFSVLSTFSQGFIDYQNDSRMFFGINAGGTYHTNTEIKTLYKAGISGHLGFSMFMQKDNLLSLDFRAKIAFKRYQGQAESKYQLSNDYEDIYPNYFYGIDAYKNNLGYFIPNFRNDVYSAAAELVLNTNRLRQNTGLNFYIFGGYDLVLYNPTTDFYNDNQGLQEHYDYDLLNDLKTESILNLHDGEFESDLGFTNYSSFVPSIGFGFSYQISKSLAIFIEHKTTFPQNNIFDGLNRDIESNQITNKNDIFHFGSIGFKFHIMKFHISDDEPDDRRVYSDPIGDKDPVNNYTDPDNTNENESDDEIIEIKQAPVINFTQPLKSPEYTTNSFYNVKADIKYVYKRQNVSFSVNNQPESSFSYDEKTGKFSSTIVLKEGNNSVKIHAYNNYGDDVESVIIVNYTPENPKPPIIYFTKPQTETTNTNKSEYTLTAQADNINNKSSITLKHNNIIIPKSKYSVNNNFSITYKALLKKGENSFTIRAKNENGFDIDNCKIIYSETVTPCEPPVIINLKPASDLTTERKIINLSCTVKNYTNSLKYSIIHNGNTYRLKESSPDFSYMLELKKGINSVLIKAENECGTDISRKLQITYKKPDTGCDEPQISLISKNNSVTFNSSTNIKANVLYLRSENDIIVYQKSKQIPFNFNPSDNSLSINNVNLSLGSNTIKIIAENDCGKDESDFIIIREICEKPEISFKNPETNTTNYTYRIKAEIKNAGKQQIKLSLNKSNHKFSFDESTGILSADLNLNPGRNIIDIFAKNDCGRELKTHNIIREQPCDKLKYDFVKPAGLNFTSSSNTIYFQLNTQHVKSSGIIVKLNGKAVKYSFINNQITIKKLMLKYGTNNLTINLKNDCSNKTLTYNLIYEDCEKPIISFKNPETNTTNYTYRIKAEIKNAGKQQIKLSLNKSNHKFSFDESTGILSADLNLNPGRNIIDIFAKNDCGRELKTHNIIREQPCDKLKYDFVKPAGLNFTSSSNTIYFQLNTQHVKSSGIIVKLNGKAVKYSFINNQITIKKLMLKYGTNNLTINLKNDCSNKTLTYNLIYEKCEKPVITYKSATTFNNLNANISAKIDKLNGGSIKLYLNNQSKNFNYNKNTKMLTTGLSLKEGNNVLKIVAKGCKTTTKTVNLKYQGPCDNIRYELLQPSSSYEIAMNKNYTFKMSVFNVQNSTLKLNGKNVNHSINNNMLIANLNLIPGINNITLSLNNACSNENFNFKIELKSNNPNYPVYDLSSKGNFCIKTSKLTINKNYLSKNKKYSYSGAVKSIYFKTTSNYEIKYKGNVYPLKANRYYLITGKTNIKFTPINKKGKTQWKMIINTNSLPQEFKSYSAKKDPCATSKKLKKGGAQRR